MDKLGSPREAGGSLLSRQVSGARYFFLDLAANRRAGLVVALGGREVCNPDYVVQRDSYAFFVLEIVVAGEGSVTLDGRTHALAAGSVFATAPNTRCEIHTHPERVLTKYFVACTGTACAPRLTRAGVAPGRVRFVPGAGEVASIVEDLLREGRHASPQTREVCAHLFEILLLKITALARQPSLQTDQAREHFVRCKAIIDAGADRLMSLGEIARAVSLEESSVCRLFRRFQGTSPYQYLLRRKMNLAAELLMERGGLVKEVSERVGFADPFHFSRVFKSVHGIAPRDFLRSLGRRS